MKNPAPEQATSERLVFFSDAAAAIALTLLILPLMDAVGEASRSSLDTLGYLRANQTTLFSFVLSFVIIARFWRAHHGLFTRAEREVNGIFTLNMVWLLAIVFLPVATALVGALPNDPIQYTVYIGTLIAASLAMLAMTVLLQRHPETWTPGVNAEDFDLAGSITVTAMLTLALLIALLVPGAGYWSLLVLFLDAPIGRLLERRKPRSLS